MGSTRRVASGTGLVGLVGLLTTACIGGTPLAPNQPTAESSTPTAGPVSIPTIAVTVVPTIGPSPTPAPPAPSGPGKNFDSPLYNYSINAPKDWQFGPGAGKIGSVASDLYTGPTVDGIPTQVNIVAQNLPTGVTDTPGFFRRNVAALQTAGTQPRVVGSVPVGTSRATMLGYQTKQPSSDQTAQVRQVNFVMANRGWVMTLTSAARSTDAGVTDFRSMLQSFKPK